MRTNNWEFITRLTLHLPHEKNVMQLFVYFIMHVIHIFILHIIIGIVVLLLYSTRLYNTQLGQVAMSIILDIQKYHVHT